MNVQKVEAKKKILEFQILILLDLENTEDQDLEVGKDFLEDLEAGREIPDQEYRRSRSRSRERFPRRSRSRERDSRPRTRRSRSRSRERIYGNSRRRSRSRERHNRLTEQQVPPTITSTDINLTENNIISQPDITQPDVNPISTDITKPPP